MGVEVNDGEGKKNNSERWSKLAGPFSSFHCQSISLEFMIPNSMHHSTTIKATDARGHTAHANDITLCT